MKDNLEDRIRRSRVFVLGAGFSAAAGVPLTADLLVRSMKKFASECPGIYARVLRYAKEATESLVDEVDFSSVDFSDLCTFLEYVELREFGGGERWSDAGSREKLALRFFLAKTIAEHTPAPEDVPDLYLEFASQLHERDIVLSFNWDCLLEAALIQLGRNYSYNYEDEDAIKIIKLHGSVNWRLDEPKNFHGKVNTLGWEPISDVGGMMEKPIYQTKALTKFGNWWGYQPLGELEPFLVLPGYGKAFDVRSNAELWYKPEFVFALTHDVYIIGLSLAPDDFFIRSFFLSNLPYIGEGTRSRRRRISIINPDDLCVENYKFVLSEGAAELIKEPFSTSHVDMMRERIS